MKSVEELIQYFNETFGFENPWPQTFEVDAELYGKCCQYVFTYYLEREQVVQTANHQVIALALGLIHGGLMFKNVELVIKK